jgi:hypothetical protein
LVSVYLTTQRRLVTVVELGREPPQPPERAARPLVLAAELHAGWAGARSWLGLGARLLPRLEYVPDLMESLEGALSEAVEGVERSMREAGWPRDYS